MKRSSNLNLFLLLMFCLPIIATGQKNFEAKNITQDSLSSLENQIRDYYNTELNEYTDILDVEDAIDEIIDLMNLLFIIPVDDSCYEGKIEDIFVGSSGGNSLDVVWEEGDNVDAYFGAYIDLRLNRIRPFSYNQSRQSNSVGVEVPDYIDKKFFAFNGRCGMDVQSSYYIIIIEKDLDFNFMANSGNNPESEEGESVPSGGSGASAVALPAQLSVFPNPLSRDICRLEFSLDKKQQVSAYIVNSSGKLVHSILSDQLFERGTYRYDLNLERLGPGMYFIILECDAGYKVEKLVLQK